MSTIVKAPHSPVDQSAAQPSRRRLIAAITSLAAAAAWLPAVAAAAPDPDRELIALGLEYDLADAALDAAFAEHDRCCEAYEAIEPQPGDAMRHRINDLALNLPIGPNTTAIGGVRPEDADPYTADEVDRLRHVAPPWRIADADRQRERVAEIRGEYDRWTAACAAARAATGLDNSEAAVGAAVAALNDVARRIAGVPATTVAGLQVRAKIIALLSDGDLTGGCDGDSIYRIMLWSIVRDLAAMERQSA